MTGFAGVAPATACARRARRPGRVLLAIFTLSIAVPAAGDTLPPALRIAHRLTENLPDLLRGLARFTPVVRTASDSDPARRCAAVAWDALCGTLTVDEARQCARRCRDVLSAADAALARTTFAADAMPALAVRSFRQRISSEAFRLSSLLRVLALQGCGDHATGPDELVALTLLDGGRTVLVEPDRGLAPGAAYAIRERSGATLRPGRTGPTLPDVRELDAARALARRLDAAAGHLTTWPGMPAFTVALAEPAETAPFWPPPVRLGRSRVREEPSFRTDAAATRRADRAVECPPATESAADLLASLDARGRVLGVRRGVLPPAPDAGRPESVPFLVALPGEQTRGVVLLLHSLDASARVVLASLAGALAERRFASVALDLPGHGGRLALTGAFLDPADPARFAGHAAQALREILALVDILRRCPAAIGLPAAFPVDHVGVFGYSIGATLGLLAASADAGVSPIVLTAPAADVFLWQRLLVARHVGLLRRVCLGTPDGPTCTEDGPCADGVPCDHHPGIWLFAPAVAPAYRFLLGDVDPMAGAGLLRAPDARPLLVQGATDDVIVFSTITRRVGDALDLPEAFAGDLPRRARRMWPGGHALLADAAVRTEAADFLARYWDDAGPLR